MKLVRLKLAGLIMLLLLVTLAPVPTPIASQAPGAGKPALRCSREYLYSHTEQRAIQLPMSGSLEPGTWIQLSGINRS